MTSPSQKLGYSINNQLNCLFGLGNVAYFFCAHVYACIVLTITILTRNRRNR